MTWKNDSDAYSLKANYGSIEDAVKVASQKWFNKNFDATFKQTEAYVLGLPAGEYTFSNPFVIGEIVKAHPNLTLTGYNPITDTVTVQKEN